MDGVTGGRGELKSRGRKVFKDQFRAFSSGDKGRNIKRRLESQ